MAISSEARPAERSLGLPAQAVVAGYATATAAALAVQGLAAPLAGTACCAVLVAALLAHHALAGDARLDALAARRLGLRREALGLTVPAWRREAGIAAAGLPLGLLAYLIVRPHPVEAGFGATAVAGLAVALLAGAGEELLLRGLLQPLLLRAAGTAGLAWTAGLSAALYAGSRSAATVALAAALSAAAGRAARRGGSIAGVGLAHGLLVAGALVVWPVLLGPAPPPAGVDHHRPARSPAPARVAPPAPPGAHRGPAPPAPRGAHGRPAHPFGHAQAPSPVPLWRAFPLSRAGPLERPRGGRVVARTPRDARRAAPPPGARDSRPAGRRAAARRRSPAGRPRPAAGR